MGSKIHGWQKRSFQPLGTQAEFPDYDDALKAALGWFKHIATDEAHSTLRYTVAQCLEDYVTDLKIRRNEDTAQRTKQMLDKHVVPVLGQIEVAKLTSRRLKAWLNSLVARSDDAETIRRSKDSANRTLTMLKAALNLAFKDGIVRDDTAWRRVRSFKAVGRARDVFLTREQCTALLNACDENFRDLARSALLTGGRYGELAPRIVVDFDRRNGVLRIVNGKTGTRDVVLNDAGIAHFTRLASGKPPGAYLHTRDDSKPWGRAMQSRRIRDAVKAANLNIETAADRIPHATVFYSLRHTHASIALVSGVNIQVLAENMGTSIRMIEHHYGKFLRTDRRAMLNQMMLE